jgi:hypothetical protein
MYPGGRVYAFLVEDSPVEDRLPESAVLDALSHVLRRQLAEIRRVAVPLNGVNHKRNSSCLVSREDDLAVFEDPVFQQYGGLV